jgi:hypothetical protein
MTFLRIQPNLSLALPRDHGCPPPSLLEAFELPQEIHTIIFPLEPILPPRPFICSTNSSHGSVNAAK